MNDQIADTAAKYREQVEKLQGLLARFSNTLEYTDNLFSNLIKPDEMPSLDISPLDDEERDKRLKAKPSQAEKKWTASIPMLNSIVDETRAALVERDVKVLS